VRLLSLFLLNTALAKCYSNHPLKMLCFKIRFFCYNDTDRPLAPDLTIFQKRPTRAHSHAHAPTSLSVITQQVKHPSRYSARIDNFFYWTWGRPSVSGFPPRETLSTERSSTNATIFSKKSVHMCRPTFKHRFQV
jgi:hypothetical protein